jgi:hypothetical protein
MILTFFGIPKHAFFGYGGNPKTKILNTFILQVKPKTVFMATEMFLKKTVFLRLGMSVLKFFPFTFF